MTVKKLIEHLKKCDQDLPLAIFYDGEVRLFCDGAFICETSVNYIGEKKKNYVVFCQTCDVYNAKENEYTWLFLNEKEAWDD